MTAKVVSDIEKAFGQKQSCLGVFFDIDDIDDDNVSFDAILKATPKLCAAYTDY